MLKIMVVDDAQFMRVRLTKLLTGHGYKIVIQAGQAGARDDVVKPFDPDRVMGALQKVLS